ncbi:FeoA domain-containing protein [Fastidiosibacter lacustris]|uniref:FeoA domain-containing protein n=1 Tax=Fastidiosibacter lacustris TaxID=2056695 RepID=UPI000E356674|nr:FeoA domain-containing protein [Fastidiosibacter lacustris]
MTIKTKQAYKILGFNDNCPRNYMQKLLSLGFIPGGSFYIAKKALFGNPYHITIKNFSVSLRKSEILFMQVEKI